MFNKKVNEEKDDGFNLVSDEEYLNPDKKTPPFITALVVILICAVLGVAYMSHGSAIPDEPNVVTPISTFETADYTPVASNEDYGTVGSNEIVGERGLLYEAEPEEVVIDSRLSSGSSCSGSGDLIELSDALVEDDEIGEIVDIVDLETPEINTTMPELPTVIVENNTSIEMITDITPNVIVTPEEVVTNEPPIDNTPVIDEVKPDEPEEEDKEEVTKPVEKDTEPVEEEDKEETVTPAEPAETPAVEEEEPETNETVEETPASNDTEEPEQNETVEPTEEPTETPTEEETPAETPTEESTPGETETPAESEQLTPDNGGNSTPV